MTARRPVRRGARGARRARRERAPLGCAVEGPGLYVWEATSREADWARELAAFAAALPRARPR